MNKSDLTLQGSNFNVSQESESTSIMDQNSVLAALVVVAPFPKACIPAGQDWAPNDGHSLGSPNGTLC